MATNDGENNVSASAECTPLLGSERNRVFMTLKQKFHCRSQGCCLTSKAAVLILLWNLILVAGLKSFFDPSFYNYMVGNELIDIKSITILSGIVYSVIAFLFLFYPLAGFLADVRWGKYKTVANSVCVIWGIEFCGNCSSSRYGNSKYHDSWFFSTKRYQDNASNIQNFIILCVTVGVVFVLPFFTVLLLLLCGLIFFGANVIQYGI